MKFRFDPRKSHDEEKWPGQKRWGAKSQRQVEAVEDGLAAREKEDRIEQLLSELKPKRGA